MLKFFYDKFWYPVLGKIFSNFIFIFEGRNYSRKKKLKNKNKK